MERARAAGRDLSAIASVASFFVSRVDTEVDARLDKIGTAEAAALQGQGGDRQRPAGLPALRAGLRRRPVAGAAGGRCPARSGRCGPRPASRTLPTPTPATSSTWSHPAWSTPCPRPPCGGRRPRHHPRRHHPAVLRQMRSRCSTTSPLSESTTTTSCDLLEDEGVAKFEASWAWSAANSATASAPHPPHPSAADTPLPHARAHS